MKKIKLKINFSDLLDTFNVTSNDYFRKQHIGFAIMPASHSFYDLIAFGDYDLLETLSNKNKDYNFVKFSKFGGIPILLIDTFTILGDAYAELTKFKKRYETIR